MSVIPQSHIDDVSLVKDFNKQLNSILESKPPISRAKVQSITKMALSASGCYKHIVMNMEKFIQKCKTEYKLPGLYLIDSVVRQSRHQNGANKDVFGPRFLRNIEATFLNLTQCDEEDKKKIGRVLSLWQKSGVYSEERIKKLIQIISYAPESSENAPQSIDARLSSLVKGASSEKHSTEKVQKLHEVLSSARKVKRGLEGSKAKFDSSLIRRIHNLTSELLNDESDETPVSLKRHTASNLPKPPPSSVQRLGSIADAPNDSNAATSEGFEFSRNVLDFDYGSDEDGADMRRNIKPSALLLDTDQRSMLSTLVPNTSRNEASHVNTGLGAGDNIEPIFGTVSAQILAENPQYRQFFPQPRTTDTVVDKYDAPSQQTKKASEKHQTASSQAPPSDLSGLKATSVAHTSHAQAAAMASRAAANVTTSATDFRWPHQMSTAPMPNLNQPPPPPPFGEVSRRESALFGRSYIPVNQMFTHPPPPIHRAPGTPSCYPVDMEWPRTDVPPPSVGNQAAAKLDQASDYRQSIQQMKEEQPPSPLKSAKVEDKDARKPPEELKSRRTAGGISPARQDQPDEKDRRRSASRSHKNRRQSSPGRSRQRDRRERDRERRHKGLPPIRDGYMIICTRTVWLGHLPKSITDSELHDLLDHNGPIEHIKLVPPRGCAFVCFEQRKHAVRCVDRMSGDFRYQGQNLKLSWAANIGVKDKRERWDSKYGCTYIPIEDLENLTGGDIMKLAEGGEIEEDSIPSSIITKIRSATSIDPVQSPVSESVAPEQLGMAGKGREDEEKSALMPPSNLVQQNIPQSLNSVPKMAANVLCVHPTGFPQMINITTTMLAPPTQYLATPPPPININSGIVDRVWPSANPHQVQQFPLIASSILQTQSVGMPLNNTSGIASPFIVEGMNSYSRPPPPIQMSNFNVPPPPVHDGRMPMHPHWAPTLAANRESFGLRPTPSPAYQNDAGQRATDEQRNSAMARLSSICRAGTESPTDENPTDEEKGEAALSPNSCKSSEADSKHQRSDGQLRYSRDTFDDVHAHRVDINAVHSSRHPQVITSSGPSMNLRFPHVHPLRGNRLEMPPPGPPLGLRPPFYNQFDNQNSRLHMQQFWRSGGPIFGDMPQWFEGQRRHVAAEESMMTRFPSDSRFGGHGNMPHSPSSVHQAFPRGNPSPITASQQYQYRPSILPSPLARPALNNPFPQRYISPGPPRNRGIALLRHPSEPPILNNPRMHEVRPRFEARADDNEYSGERHGRFPSGNFYDGERPDWRQRSHSGYQRHRMDSSVDRRGDACGDRVEWRHDRNVQDEERHRDGGRDAGRGWGRQSPSREASHDLGDLRTGFADADYEPVWEDNVADDRHRKPSVSSVKTPESHRGGEAGEDTGAGSLPCNSANSEHAIKSGERKP